MTFTKRELNLLYDIIGEELRAVERLRNDNSDIEYSGRLISELDDLQDKIETLLETKYN